MNKTELLKTVWDILESRDLTILKGRKELRAIQHLLYQTQLELANTIEQSVERDKANAYLQGDVKQPIQQGQAKQESLQQIIKERETQIKDIQNKLNLSEENRLLLLRNIDQLQEKLNKSQATIIGMESSKFWQLRNHFLKLKKSLGLKTED